MNEPILKGRVVLLLPVLGSLFLAGGVGLPRPLQPSFDKRWKPGDFELVK